MTALFYHVTVICSSHTHKEYDKEKEKEKEKDKDKDKVDEVDGFQHIKPYILWKLMTPTITWPIDNVDKDEVDKDKVDKDKVDKDKVDKNKVDKDKVDKDRFTKITIFTRINAEFAQFTAV